MEVSPSLEMHHFKRYYKFYCITDIRDSKRVLVRFTHTQRPQINAHDNVLSGTRSVKFGLSSQLNALADGLDLVIDALMI